MNEDYLRAHELYCEPEDEQEDEPEGFEENPYDFDDREAHNERE